MSKGNINYYFYLLAFIDVLGQKEVFQELENEPLSDNHPKLIEAHKQTALFVDKLRSGFKDFFDAYTADKEPSVKVPSEKMEAYVCLHTDQYHSNAINGVFGALLACGGMLLLSLASKKAFRAGIEVGLGTELGNGGIYGPVLYKAYELEHKVAECPRIVIGQELINYLGQLANSHQQMEEQVKEDVELCKLMATNCLKMIVRDLDGVPILDYLGDEFMRSINENPERAKEYRNVFDLALQFVEA